jgi:hypothetical protein
MADNEIKRPASQETEKSPVVWLAVHEAAVKRGDIPMVYLARRKLAKLGVVIQAATEGGTR